MRSDIISTTSDSISSGGTITGDLTISGDLTVEGGGGYAYSEVLTGDMKITNAGATVGLEVEQTGNGVAVTIDQQRADQFALYIDSATVGDTIHIDAPASTTGNVIHIASADALTTGSAITVDSGGTALVSGSTGGLVEILHTGDSDTNVNNLLFIHNDDGGSTGTIPLWIDQDANNHALYIDATDVPHPATKAAVKIVHADGSSVTGGNISDGTVSGCLHIDKTGDQDGAGSCILLSSNTNACQSAIAHIQVDDNDADLAFYTDNAGTLTEAMRIDNSQNVGIGTAAPVRNLEISYANTTTTVSDSMAGMAADEGVLIRNTDATGDCYAHLDFRSGNADGRIAYQYKSSNVGEYHFLLDNAGAQTALVIDANSRISLSNNDGNDYNTVFGYHALTNAGTVLGDVGADYNVAVGHLAMGTGTTTDATYNTAIGTSVLESIIDGDENVCIGSSAGYALTTANKCVFIGRQAGDAVTATNGTLSDGSVAIGYQALSGLTSGAYNVAIGESAGATLSTEHYNTFVGRRAGMLSNGGNNTVLGSSAFDAATVNADDNVAIGYNAMGGAIVAEDVDDCVAIGSGALSGDLDSTDGADKASGTVAIGKSALTALTSGSHNTAIGYNALALCTEGDANVAIGYNALDAMAGEAGVTENNTGDNNIAIGYESMSSMNAGTHAGALTNSNIAIGTQALLGGNFNTADLDFVGNIAIGHQAVYATSNNAQTGTIGIGHQALTALTSGARNTALGYETGGRTTTGADNTYIGYQAGDDTRDDSKQNTVVGSLAFAGTHNTADADDCVAIGYSALGAVLQHANVSGTVAIGSSALNALTSGAGNLAIGYQAMLTHTEGSRNMAIGYGAMDDTDATAAADGGAGGTPGTLNTHDCLFIGFDAGGGTWAGSDSNYNVGIGNYVMDGALDGAENNTAVGYQAGTAITTGDSNVIVGKSAGVAIEDGSSNVCIGYYAGQAITSGTTNTCVGDGSNAAATAANQIAIGNSAITDGANKGRWGNSSVDTNNIQVDWTVDSDSRIKKDVESSDIGLSFVNALKTRKYKKKHPSEYDAEILEARYKQGGANYDDDKDAIIKDEFDDDKVWNGLIAQEVKAVMDDLDVEFSGWSEDTKGKQGIQYSTLVVPLIKAVQELSAEVESLKEQLNS